MFKMCRMYHLSNVMSNCTTLCIPRSCSWRGLDCHYDNVCPWSGSRLKAIKTRPLKCHRCQQCSLIFSARVKARLPIFAACLHGESHSANASPEALALGRASPARKCDRDVLVDFMGHSDVRKMKPEGLVRWITPFNDSRVFNHIRSKSGPQDYHWSKSFQMGWYPLVI